MSRPIADIQADFHRKLFELEALGVQIGADRARRRARDDRRMEEFATLTGKSSLASWTDLEITNALNTLGE